MISRRTLPRLAYLGAAFGVLGLVAWASMAFGTLEAAGQVGAYGQSVVWSLRWPRTIAGLAVGAALGVAGALMQAVSRNPLADPSVLGVNAGAAFAIVLVSVWGHLDHPSEYLWFAFAGGAVAATTVWMMGGTGRGGGSPAKLALAGVVLTALIGSWTTALLLNNNQTLDTVRFWLAGALGGRDPEAFAFLLPFLVAGLAAAFVLARSLDLMGLGDDASRALGLRSGLVRNLTLGLVVWLSGVAVALAGPIGFIGLAVPHLARFLAGPDQRWILGFSLVLGPGLLLGADVLGRVVLRPSEVPVGIVTALLGAPLLIVFARARELR